MKLLVEDPVRALVIFALLNIAVVYAWGHW